MGGKCLEFSVMIPGLQRLSDSLVMRFTNQGMLMPDENSPDWGQIVERHAERVFRIAFRILGSVQDAEDVSQIVFTEAVEVHAAGPVQSWIGLFVRLATRAIIELREWDQISNVGPFDEAVGAELANWLRAAVNQLPEQQAAVFSLSYFEQLDRNEVAAVLGISPESVSTTLYKARQRLMTQIAVFNGER
jgi:RNA polymerase sigma-70 factor, ECF subfamily